MINSIGVPSWFCLEVRGAAPKFCMEPESYAFQDEKKVRKLLALCFFCPAKKGNRA